MNELATQLHPVVERLCDVSRTTEDSRQACMDVSRFHRTLAESGHITASSNDGWRVLEGDALRQHSDPLGALQRGEVPAVMLRGFVPPDELRRMLTRMAQMTTRFFTCRFGANISAATATSNKAMRAARISSKDDTCIELNRISSTASLAWPHWCTLLSHVEHDCAQLGEAADAPECLALRSRHPVFDRCNYDYGKKRRTQFTRLRVDRVVRLAAREFGQKLYGNLYPAAKPKFMRSAEAIDAMHGLMARGCTGRYCSPKHAMLAGVAELAGAARLTRQAEERPGQKHSPGTIRAMTNGWSTPLHMDSKHSSAFAALRKELCDEDVTLSMKTSPGEASRFRALTRHRFAASAILTLHAPNRTHNPVDLNIFRHRWPSLLHNCSVRAVDAYGVGVRFQRATVPQQVLDDPLTVKAEPGDLFLFNSEFFQCANRQLPCARRHSRSYVAVVRVSRLCSDTPRILGSSSRTVFNSFAGFSAGGSPVEVYA